MFKSSLYSEIRNNVGSNESNRIRNSGYIPGVIYGYNIVAKSIELDRNEVNSIIRNYSTNVLVDLEVNGEKITSMIKEIQRDPVSKDVIHIDFQSVSFNRPVQATIPIVLVDKPSVGKIDATIQHQLREAHIECLPQNIPESIEISVKDLTFGNPIKIEDVEFAQEIVVLNEGDEVIASLTKAGMIDDEEVEKKLITENDFEPIEKK